jgi:hypothetical protein
MVFAFFGMALIGLAIHYGLVLHKFNQETPGLGFIPTFKKFFSDKLFALITNILIIIALTIILAVDSTDTSDKAGWFMKLLTGEDYKGNLTSQFYFVSLFIGFSNQALFSAIFGKRNPIVGFDKNDGKKGDINEGGKG